MKHMDNLILVFWTSISLLCLSSEGSLQMKKEENAVFLEGNSPIDTKLNNSNITVTDYIIGNISEETTTQLIVKFTTLRIKNTTVMNIRVDEPHFVIMPLAIGGIALLSGLLLISIVEVSLVTAPVQVQSISPLSLPVGSLDSSGSNRGCAGSEIARVGVESTKKPTPDVVVVSGRDVTALALSYGTFPLRKV
ncbi:hypothetical protein TNCV_3691201 [Trichonephila clavipes]|nr:hypothetical protein TNCV_3691201 [Trichonephila clavipes]